MMDEGAKLLALGLVILLSLPLLASGSLIPVIVVV